MMDVPQKPSLRKFLRGKLTISRLLDACSWFVPARAEDHPLQLGWRLAPPTGQMVISFDRISGLSAECTAAFGALRGVFPDEESVVVAPPPSQRPPTPWERIISGDFEEEGEWQLLPSGGAALALEAIEVGTPEKVEQIVERLTDRILKAPGETGRQLNRLREVLRRLLTELLMNVYEHAYTSGNSRRAWVCAMLIPCKNIAELHAWEGGQYEAELNWVERIRNQEVLEISVADAGIGIPASLAPSSIKILPSLTKALKKMPSGHREFTLQRKLIHAELCDHAFRHFSTRKNASEYATEHHRMNWRGLYRCYRQVIDLGGTISVTSGQGRAGYISTLSGTTRFARPLDSKGDFPGTLVTVRFPLPPSRRRPQNKPPDTSQQLTLHKEILLWSKLRGVDANHLPQSTPSDLSGTEHIAIAFPFLNMADEAKAASTTTLAYLDLRRAIEGLQQHVVPVVCFVGSNEDWRDGLRRFVPNEYWLPERDGPPRLVGYLTRQARIEWGFAGAIPEIAEKVLKDFENDGQWEPSSNEDPTVVRLFRELRAHYPEAVVWDLEAKRFQLKNYQTRLSITDFQAVFNCAFQQHWQTEFVRDEIVTEGGDKVIVLPTGTRVRRHFSVFKMLNQSDSLTRAFGSLLRLYLLDLNPTGQTVIVIDQPGSRYIVQAMLEHIDEEHNVYSIDDLEGRVKATRPVIVFSDAVFHGRTAEHAVEEVRRLGYTISTIIACVDLRTTGAGEAINNVPFLGLASPDGFSPVEVNDFSGMDELQTDVLTNVVAPSVISPFLQLSDAEDRRLLLQHHPEIFCTGFHLRGGRTHSVSLPFRRLLEICDAQTIANWFCDAIKRRQDALGFQLHGRDVVIFTPFDSRVSSIVEYIATKLKRPPFNSKNTFLVRMPVAHAGSHSIFPPADSNPLSGCTEVGAGRFSFVGAEKPNPDYVALYLADASVTGNSLRHFLYRVVTASSPRPVAVFAVVGVNRLSPGEIRFFQLCQTLEHQGAKEMPFFYDYLFNLQIRSRPAELRTHHPLLDAVLTEPLLAVGELRDYLENLRVRSANVLADDGESHIFCPVELKSKCSITSEAIRLRHILALNQQNEPVILEVLRLLKLMTSLNTEDPSILCVLALEPDLLLAPPLRQFGRPLLTELAMRVLDRKECSLPLKSDALVILASYPRALQNNFPRIADALLGIEPLRLQSAIHLLEGNLHRNIDAISVIENYLSLPDINHAEEAMRLRDLLEVCSTLNRLNRATTRRADCDEAVRRLGSQMLHHAAGFEDDWDGLGADLNSLAVYWDLLSSEQRIQATLNHCWRGVKLAESVLLPGISAFAICARSAPNPDLAKSLEDSYSRALTLLRGFKQKLNSYSDKLTHSNALELHSLFTSLRSATWLSPTTERLLGGQKVEEATSGPLPLAFPQLFSAPLPLIQQVSLEVFRTPTAISSIPDTLSHSKAPLLCVCPVPVGRLRHIYRLLLGNIQRCGQLDSITADENIINTTADGKFTWRIMISNSATSSAHGQGIGITEAQRLGMPVGIDIHSSEVSTDHWETVISISGCFSISRTKGENT